MQEVKRENPPADRTDLPDSEIIRVEAPLQAVLDGPSAREQYRRLYRLMVVTDGLSVAMAFSMAHALRFGFGLPKHQHTSDFVLSLILGPLFVLTFFAAFRLYEVHHFTPAEEFRRIILAVSLGVMGFAVLDFWSKTDLSRGWIGGTLGLAVGLVSTNRPLWRLVHRSRAS